MDNDIPKIDEFLTRKLCESIFLTSVVPIPYIRPTNSDGGRAQRAPAIMAGWDSREMVVT
jgi:hypothetical protein